MTDNTAISLAYNLREKAWRANVAGVLETIAASASDQDVRRAVQDVVEQLKEDRIHVSIRQSMFTSSPPKRRPQGGISPWPEPSHERQCPECGLPPPIHTTACMPWKPGDRVRDEWRGAEFEAAVYRVVKYLGRSGMIPWQR